MYFKRIEIHGFKSFADPVVIEFDQGITCVVGPNGSGKSNISDAIRWVLGEQSARTLRGGKMEDVIFAGTQNRKSRGMAEVTLVIDNSEGILKSDYREVAITRRIFRSGESEYEINREPRKMREIREMIMDTGIGVDGYSLIGQGKISEIISNKTESIREIFEETAGIVSYRTKKRDAERKLSNAKDNLDRVCDIIAEIESRIDGLHEDSDKAKEYLKLKERYEKLEVNITLKEIDKADDKVKTLKEDVEGLLEDIVKNDHFLKDLDSTLEEAKLRRHQLESKNTAYRDELLALTSALAEIEKDQEVSGARREHLNASVQRLGGEIEELEAKIDQGEQEIEKLNRELNEIRRNLADKRGALGAALDQQSGKQAGLTQLNDSIKARRQAAFDSNTEMISLREELASVERNIETLTERRSSMENEKSDESDLRDRLVQAHRTSEERANGLAEKINKIRDEIEKINKDIADAERRRKDNFAKVEAKKVELGRAQSRCKTLEEMESSYEGYQAGVRYVMKAKLPGIEGVVGELIDVPTGMELAIETALAGGMQNIVCTTDKAAKDTIERLKRDGAGRVTLLPIESIRPRPRAYEEELEDMVGFVDYAIDAVSFDEKHRKPMQYLLGNILIFNNLDNAMEASKSLKKSFRIVTLDGEVLNAAGAVTGGRYKNNRANLLERKSDIGALQNDIENLHNEIAHLSAAAKEASKQEGDLRQEAQAKTEELGKCREYLVEVREELAQTRTRLNSISETEEKRSSQLSFLVEQQSNLEADADRLKRELADKKAAFKLLEDEIADLEARFSREQGKVSDDSEGITKLRVEEQELRSSEEAKQDIIGRRQEDVAGYKRQKDLKQEELSMSIKEIDMLASQARGSEYGDKLKRKEEVSQELTQIKDLLENCDRDIDEGERQREEARKAMDSLQSQKYDIEIKIAKNDSKVDNLKEKLWEEFEMSYAQALDMQEEDFAVTKAVSENRQIKARLRELGDVNIGAIEEYEEVSSRYKFMTAQRDDVQNSMDELDRIIRDLESIIRRRFKESFTTIVENFRTTFTEFFGGGQANIEIEDEDNPLESEISITAQPPGKQLTHINLLSGGEKTMTAIALMFSVLKTKPTPCCVLDEVDAALDDSNIEIFADYLKNFRGTQFTLITHQKDMMEKADVMYGVTMPEHGVSKILSLNVGEMAKAEEILAEEPKAANMQGQEAQ